MSPIDIIKVVVHLKLLVGSSKWQIVRVFNTNDTCDMHWILKLHDALL
jgi:hypothetical protein